MSFLKLISTLSLFLLLITPTKDPEGIKISVRKGHKKITYVAQNITDKDIDIFFKVNSKGFRRSADRPIITTIPAQSKKDLITLIPLKGADTTHSYMAVLTKAEYNIGIKKTKEIEKDVRRIDPEKKN